MNELLELKSANLEKALRREEPDWIPTVVEDNGGTLFCSEKPIDEILKDPKLLVEESVKPAGKMWIDGATLWGYTTTKRLGETFPGAETKISPEGNLSHYQTPHMQDSEYDQLIADPAAFTANVLLPRKHPYLFESRSEAKEKMKVYAEEKFGLFVVTMGALTKKLEDDYGIRTFVTPMPMLDTPLDHLFDFYRGFSGTLTDLRRHKAQVKEACEAIWEWRWADLTSKPYDFKGQLSFQPCHIPAYLNPKQFDEFYWPYEKKLIEWVHNSGSKCYIILEGEWKDKLKYFLEVPKDSCVLHVDDDDFTEAYKVLGQHQILVGGLRAAEARMKPFEELKDDIKRVIDTCAPGGGFLFTPDKAWIARGDVNQTMIDTFNFVHEYSKKG